MNALNFTFWLQGFIEVSKPKTISPEQLTEIRNHLRLTLGQLNPPKEGDLTLKEGKVRVVCVSDEIYVGSEPDC